MSIYLMGEHDQDEFGYYCMMNCDDGYYTNGFGIEAGYGIDGWGMEYSSIELHGADTDKINYEGYYDKYLVSLKSTTIPPEGFKNDWYMNYEVLIGNHGTVLEFWCASYLSLGIEMTNGLHLDAENEGNTFNVSGDSVIYNLYAQEQIDENGNHSYLEEIQYYGIYTPSAKTFRIVGKSGKYDETFILN